MNKSVKRKTRLWKLHYRDPRAEVHLVTYADTIIFDKENDKQSLVAIRFGGYAEHVRGMADAIYGGGKVVIEVENESLEFQCLTKQYRRMLSNDNIYTEATLLANDDFLKANESQNDDNSQKKQDSDMVRTCYLFCEQDDMEQLFEEIDKKVSIPLIPEFKDYVITELQNQNILKKLTVFSLKEKFDAWRITLSKDEKNVIKVIEDGLESGVISIPGSNSDYIKESPDSTELLEADNSNDAFSSINTVSNYLDTFGVTIAEKIKGQFTPLFDPSTEKLSKEVLVINDYIKKKAGYHLYDAQLAEAEALKKRLDISKFGLCVAECGSGKTKIGSTALYAHQMSSLQRSDNHNNKSRMYPKTFNIVLCPSHLSKKWVREIEESLPNTVAVHIKSITELNKVYGAYKKYNKSCYVVITKEKARDGYMKRPSVKWNERQEAFLCPNCYKPIMMDIIDNGAKYKVEANSYFFQKENKKNHKCENCSQVLWTPLISEQKSEWVKISNYGFIHIKHARMHLNTLRSKVIHSHSMREQYLEAEEKTENDKDIENETQQEDIANDAADDNQIKDKNGKIIEFPKAYHDIKAVVDNPAGHFRAVGAYKRFPLSTYIKNKMRGKIDGLILDELQDYNNNSGQGDAMNELFGCAKKVIGLTGTLINGYSQGIFYLLYRISPYLMQIDDKKYTSTKEFNDEYGVTESVYELSGSEYNSNRRTIRRKLRERQLPGVSPLVYSRFLIDSTAFLSLNDMGKQLPEYEEIPVELKMNSEVSSEYKRIEDEFVDVLKYEKEIARKVMSAFMSLLTVYPDQPYDMKSIINPLTGQTIITPEDTSDFDTLNEKDIWLLEKVKEKVLQGGKVIVYTSWVRIDTQEKLLKLFKENNIKADVLTSSVVPNKREEWVEKHVNNGMQVLITNPSLVETGLDLNDFATLVYYNIGYKLFTLRQSSRRSWRINQKAPRVEVYFLYFKDVMQHRAIRLMASKLAVAGIIEGNFTDEGLSAMSECQDLTTLLAQELTLGLKNEVEDLSAVFKKMAVLKPESEPEQTAPENQEIYNEPLSYEANLIETNQIIISETAEITEPSITAQYKNNHEKDSENLSAAKSSISQTKPKRKAKAAYIDPRQISLFDPDYCITA